MKKDGLSSHNALYIFQEYFKLLSLFYSLGFDYSDVCALKSVRIDTEMEVYSHPHKNVHPFILTF